MIRNAWTDARIDSLRKLKEAGYSASKIAIGLNHLYRTSYTRCAVLGKIYRMRNKGTL